MPRKIIYAEIAKTTKGDDGTLVVEGFASTGAEDSDKETVTPEAMKAAIPDYMRFGAVREMHDSKRAAGTALEAEVLGDGKTRFVAHVVDPVAVQKVEAGVYKGFSIGARVPKDGRDPLNKSVIKAIELIEVSLVDRPANPEALITCYKAEGAGPENEEDDPVDDDDVSKVLGAAVAKGLYTVQNMLSALGYLKDCASCISYEVQEGSHSEEMSKGIKACLKSLGAFCQKYLGDEVAMLGKTDWPELARADGELIAKGAGLQSRVDELEKASKERAAQDAEQAGQVAEVAKAAGIELAEGALYADLLKGAFAQLIERTAQVDAANKELAELRKRAAAPRALTNAMAIAKSADVAGPGEQAEVVKNGDGTTNEAASLIKSAHRQPIRVGMPG